MLRKIISAAAATLLAAFAFAPVSATSLTVKDGNNATQQLRTVTNSDSTQSYVHAEQDSSGTLVDPATKQLQQAILTALGSPFQAGTSIANTAFGISGTLPAFTSPPTVNLGTVPSLTIATLPALPSGANGIGTVGVTSSVLPTGASTAAAQATGNTSLAAIAIATAPSVFANGATGAASALAGSGTYTGASRDSGIAAGTQHGISYFNAFFLADQAGTARIDCSNDGITWYACATSSLTAATPLILSMPIMTRYHRAVVINGSTAETYLWVNTSYTGA